MSAAHTPGPWSAAFSKALGASVLRGPDAQHLGTIHSERDACLIATAPALLAVLREFRDQFDAFDPSDKKSRHAMRMTLISCDAVIAKATGSQQ